MIEVREISKSFSGFKVLDNISLRVTRGEMLALLGPSGCGKTTLLRVIPGLEVPDAGCVLLGGDDATFQRARDR